VDALDETCKTLLSSLRQLAEGEISAAQFSALDALRLEIGPGPSGVVDPLALADLEDALSSWLTDNDVERDWVIAPPLAAAGVDVAWCERASTILGPDALEAGLVWVASTYATTTLLGELKEATRRVSELVGAVRSYSQMDRGSLQRIDVREGLESTLVMLGHELRSGVTVVRDYGPDVPEIEAYAGELNQVWTNLIDNAVDAMDGVGTLTITTRPDGDHVLVEVRDTGSGMPPQVVARAFEAFFTTKDVGKGSGLGLDIAHRIVVDRHGGSIDIDSRPGSTAMRVRLPAKPPS
jgi:signal transduction histidine kinase